MQFSKDFFIAWKKPLLLGAFLFVLIISLLIAKGLSHSSDMSESVSSSSSFVDYKPPVVDSVVVDSEKQAVVVTAGGGGGAGYSEQSNVSFDTIDSLVNETITMSIFVLTAFPIILIVIFIYNIFFIRRGGLF